MKNCKFCKEYNKLVKITDNDHKKDSRYSADHKVSIRSDLYFNGEMSDSPVTTKSFEINYCPECGKEIKEREENENQLMD